jgi:DNA-binding CsgD family transcriptional regulator
LDVRDPLGYLHEAFDREMHRLETRRVELAAAREALLELGNRGWGPEGSSPPLGWEHVPTEMTPAVVERLTAITSDIMRACTMTVEQGPGVAETNIREGQRRISGGLVHRALYPLSLVDTPVGQRWIRSWADVGEEQRFVDRTPTEFAVFGNHAVLAVEEWGDPGSPYVFIRDTMPVEIFTAYFDAAFSAGLPMPTERAADEDDRRLLRLLGMGIKDEAIARYLGWSLRTVRRRVARLMVELGVETRFQLGIAADRAGLIGEERGR